MRGEIVPVDQAAEILKELIQTHPDVPDYRYDLALAYANVNIFGPRFQDESSPIAEERLWRAQDLLVPITDENPTVLEYAESLASVYHQLGESVRRMNQPGVTGRGRFKSAEEALVTLEGRYPEVLSYKLWKAIVQLSMAEIDRDNQKWELARGQLDSATAALSELIDKDFDCSPFDVQALLAQSRQDLTDTIRRAQQEPAAGAPVSDAEP